MKIGVTMSAPKKPAHQPTYSETVNIQFYGMFGSYLSICCVCDQFARRLLHDFDNVGLYNTVDGNFEETDFKKHAYLNPKAPIGIFYGVPNEVPDSFFQHSFSIGGFVCETDRIHKDWVTKCNLFDLIIVPSHYCKKAFSESGVVSPILVVPHGLEPEYIPIENLRSSNEFVFYNTFNSKSFFSRKNCEELIRCFQLAFSDRPDIKLRLRTQADSRGLDKLRRKYALGRSIIIEDMLDLSTKDFAAISSQVHCTVHPSRGEGFGLIPFQSIACATPVIATGATGMLDYLDSSYANLIRVSDVVAGQAVGNQSGVYYKIDEPHLVQCMKKVVNNYDEELAKVTQVSKEFREHYSWNQVLTPFSNFLSDILSNNAVKDESQYRLSDYEFTHFSERD